MEQREIALHCAIEHARINPAATDILADAAAYLAFLQGAPVTTGAGEAAAPKETRKRRTTAAGATDTASVQSATATNVTEADASTAKSDPATDDLFGEETAPVVEEKKAPKLTIENVKAALVEVQTKLKHKDHALTLLGKHTVPKGTKVLSGLPEANWAALIAEAAVSVKNGRVAA